MNDFELVYYHILNMKMLEEGLFSRFSFQKPRTEETTDHAILNDLFLMSALKAKKLSNDIDEYEIFEEFVFHNYHTENPPKIKNKMSD